MMIGETLLKIQSELKAPKAQFNGFGKYNYRSCEDILEAVKPLCNKHGVTLTLSDTIAGCEGRVYVCAKASIFDTEGDISVTAYARESETKKGMDAAQITGAASSYARKYALNGLFCIDDTKDADSTNDHGNGPSIAAGPGTKLVDEWYASFLGCETITELQEAFPAAIKSAKTPIDKAAIVAAKDIRKRELV